MGKRVMEIRKLAFWWNRHIHWECMGDFLERWVFAQIPWKNVRDETFDINPKKLPANRRRWLRTTNFNNVHVHYSWARDVALITNYQTTSAFSCCKCHQALIIPTTQIQATLWVLKNDRRNSGGTLRRKETAMAEIAAMATMAAMAALKQWQ